MVFCQRTRRRAAALVGDTDLAPVHVVVVAGQGHIQDVLDQDADHVHVNVHIVVESLVQGHVIEKDLEVVGPSVAPVIEKGQDHADALSLVIARDHHVASVGPVLDPADIHLNVMMIRSVIAKEEMNVNVQEVKTKVSLHQDHLLQSLNQEVEAALSRAVGPSLLRRKLHVLYLKSYHALHLKRPPDPHLVKHQGLPCIKPCDHQVGKHHGHQLGSPNLLVANLLSLLEKRLHSLLASLDLLLAPLLLERGKDHLLGEEVSLPSLLHTKHALVPHDNYKFNKLFEIKMSRETLS